MLTHLEFTCSLHSFVVKKRVIIFRENRMMTFQSLSAYAINYTIYLQIVIKYLKYYAIKH